MPDLKKEVRAGRGEKNPDKLNPAAEKFTADGSSPGSKDHSGRMIEHG
ncbi:MAG: hypothetical protein V2B13_19245 [Pseudomonadota bacterium]